MSAEFDTTTLSFTIGLFVKAVVSLNNSGVSLLERARYSEAKGTLKNALNIASFVNNAFSSTGKSLQQCQQQYLSHQMNTALHLAEQHLARPCSAVENEAMTRKYITTLWNDDTSSAMETASSDFCSSQNQFAVRILSSDDDEEYTECNWHYVLAVLLQNFSVACQSPPITPSEPLVAGSDNSQLDCRVQAHRRNEEAWSACHLAHELLSRYSALRGTTTTLMAFAVPEIQRRWILMHMLVVSNLMHLSFELSKRRHAYKYYDKLCRLRQELPKAAPNDDDNKEPVDTAFSFFRQTAPAA